MSVWSAAALSAALLLGLPAGAATVSDQRGFITEGVAGRLLFQRCNASELAPQPLPLNDKTPARALGAGIDAVRLVRLEPDVPLYVEFRGETTASLVTAVQFQRAIGHVASCTAAPASPPAGVNVIAQGVQPAWRLQWSPASARLEVVGKKPVQFRPVSSTSDPATKARSFVATSATGGAQMRLEIVEQTCTDSGSETAYGARAVAQLGTRRLEGCAARF